jgi:hypothetical protein
LVIKPEGKGLLGRPTHNLKKDLKEKGAVDRIHLIQHWEWRWVVVNME